MCPDRRYVDPGIVSPAPRTQVPPYSTNWLFSASSVAQTVVPTEPRLQVATCDKRRPVYVCANYPGPDESAPRSDSVASPDLAEMAHNQWSYAWPALAHRESPYVARTPAAHNRFHAVHIHDQSAGADLIASGAEPGDPPAVGTAAHHHRARGSAERMAGHIDTRYPPCARDTRW